MMEKKLPKGWKNATISMIGKVVTGNTPSKSNSEYFNGDIPWVKPGDVKKGRVVFQTEETLSELGAEKARLIPKGAVIVTCIGDLGNVTLAGRELATNQQINSLVVDERIADYKYVYYWSLTLKSWLIQNSTSTTISMVNKSNFEKAPIIIPPLPEQKRIVAKLDVLFGHLDVLREKLDRIPELLKNFRQQVLTQAVTGGIRNKEYELRPLGYFAIKIQTGPFGSALHKSEYVLKGIPVINPSHIKNGEIIPDHRVSINNAKFSELKRWKLDDGDVIIGRRGEMGRAARYSNESGEMICGTGSLLFKKSEEVNPDFLGIYLRSPFTVNFLQKNSVGSTMINLNQKIIKSLPFPNISKGEQIEIVEHVNRLFYILERIESQYHLLKAKIDQLPQAILNKAFRGELVEGEILGEIGVGLSELEGIMAAEAVRVEYKTK
jgi:type I restriction enzyme S subunit